MRSENNQKNIVILESFITIGSFDCDHTFMNMLHVNVIIAIVDLVVVEDLEGSIGGQKLMPWRVKNFLEDEKDSFFFLRKNIYLMDYFIISPEWPICNGKRRHHLQ